MVIFRFLILCGLLLTCPAIVRADALADLKTAQETSRSKILAENQTELKKLDDQLAGALTRGKEDARKQGDLDLVKAFETQITRRQAAADPDSVPATAPEITKLESVYDAAKVERLSRLQRSLIAWYDAADLKLKEFEKKLVSENQIPAAEAVRAERERIRTDEAVRDALANREILDAAAGKSKSAAAAPSSSLPREGPWRSLVGVKWSEIDGNEFFIHGIKADNDMTIGTKVYKRREFLFTHSGGEVTYEFKQPVTEFKASACLDQNSNNGNVILIIKTDTGEIFRSGELTKAHNREEIALKFKPTTKFTIISDPNGSGAEDWAFLLLPEIR
jgi:hypothetical protein